MGSKGSQTTTQTSTNAPDAQAMAAYRDVLTRAQGVVNQNPSYVPYGGELVAGINNQQNLGIGNINSNAGYANPYIQSAIGQATNSSAPLSATAIQSYMNPYTQNVVNSTQAAFNNQNTQDVQRLRGNAIAQGALGGNRQGVAEAELTKQQHLAQDPVIANLYQQGYGQAVNTAQNQQAIGLQGAGMVGNLGVAGQNAGLQGAQAQIGAGTLQQGTQQALDTAQLQQWQQQQAFPYQQLGWLAGITGGIGGQMGGTSYGQTTSPGPNTGAQWLGAASSMLGTLGSLGMFSDERVKENIKSIGKTHDGQTIYRYNYKGDHTPQIGLIAQEVEKHKPEAVSRVNGIALVDYNKATEDAVKGRAFGGGVGMAAGGVPPIPYGGGPSYIPQVHIGGGNNMPKTGAPAPANTGSSDLGKQAASIGDLAKTLRTAMGSDMGNNGLALPAGASVPGAEGPSSVGGVAGPTPLNPVVEYARGGVVNSYSDGGTPSFDERFNNAITDLADAGSLPRFDQQATQNWRDDVDRDIGRKDPEVPEKAIEAKGVAPTASRPLAFNNDKSGVQSDELPSEITSGYSASPRRAGLSGASADYVPSDSDRSEKKGIDWGSDNKLWPALISAGFGMMASRSPFLGVAIGEGGQAGINSYNLQQQKAFEAQKLAEQLSIQRQRMQMEKEQAERPYEEMTAAEKARINFQQRQEQRQLLQPVDIGFDALGRAIKGIRDPNTGGFRIIDPQSGRLLEPGESLGGFGGTNNPLKAPANNVAPPAPVSERPRMIQASDRILSDPKLPGYMRVANEEESRRDESVLDALRNTPGGDRAVARVKGLANYEINPTSIPQKERGAYLDYAKMYDPSYDMTLYNAKQRAVNDFFGGGGRQSPAAVMTNGNTAVLHLSEMYDIAEKIEKAAKEDPSKLSQAATWVQNQNLPFLSAWATDMRNKAVKGTGSDLALALAEWRLMKQRYTEEVTAFYSGGGGSEAERERSLEAIDESRLSPRELKGAMAQDLRGLRDKVDQLQGRLIQGMSPSAWKQAVNKDPSLVLLYKNSREASDKILNGAHTGPKTESATKPATTGKPTLQEFLAKAKQANPNASDETLTEYYNKKYGQ